MSKTLTILALGLALSATATSFSAESSLFSRVRTRSVFASSRGETGGEAPARPTAPKKITGADQISGMLREMGFEPRELGDRVVSAKTA